MSKTIHLSSTEDEDTIEMAPPTMTSHETPVKFHDLTKTEKEGQTARDPEKQANTSFEERVAKKLKSTKDLSSFPPTPSSNMVALMFAKLGQQNAILVEVHA